jgi:hypothetical protein
MENSGLERDIAASKEQSSKLLFSIRMFRMIQGLR